MVPSSAPSLQPSQYGGEPTNSIGGSNTNVTSFGCQLNSSANLILDGTTNEFICNDGFNSTTTRRILAEKGFIITPNLTNPSVVEKLRVYADHNCSGCDPIEYLIEGWDNEKKWMLISTGDLPWIDEVPDRNAEGQSIDNSSYEHGDEALSFTEVKFNNSIAFSQYRLTFPRTRNESFDLVVAEVELPGREFEEIPTSAPTDGKVSSKPTKKTKKPSQGNADKPTRKPRSKTPTPKPVQTKAAKTKPPHKLRTHKPIPRPPTQKPTPRPILSKSGKVLSAKASIAYLSMRGSSLDITLGYSESERYKDDLLVEVSEQSLTNRI
jgi:hypothetical protein